MMTPRPPAPRPSSPHVHVGVAPTLSALALVLLGGACKPAGEPDRRPRSGHEQVGPVAVGSAEPRGTIRLSEWVGGTSTGAPGLPPEIAPVPEPAPRPPEPASEVVADGPDALVDSASELADDTAPPDTTAPEPTPSDAVPPTPSGPSTGPSFPVHPDFLPMTLVAELERPITAAQRETARALNKTGLDKHRRLELASAMEDYRGAIAVAPPYPFAHYNLACALALERRNDEALYHLAILALLARKDTASSDRLAAARVDADFELLRDDPRFRTLTLATPVLVTWAGNTTTVTRDRQDARTAHKLLRDARWLAQVSNTPWQLPVERSALRVRAGADPITHEAADAIHRLLEAKFPMAIALEHEAALPSEGPPLVLVITSSPAAAAPEPVAPEPEPPPTDAPEPAAPSPPPDAPPAPAPAPEAQPTQPAPTAPEAPDLPFADRLQRYLGKRLSATIEGALEHLELRPTGFFVWERRDADGASVRRNGRWSVQAMPGDPARGLLTLSYKETRIGVGADAPVEVVEGLETTHRLAIDTAEAHGLTLDRQTFR